MKVLTNNQYYSEIANVIREQNGTNNTYTPPQMVSALKDLFYEEVEGVPPITFQGIGENLLDYRIDGASGGVGESTYNLLDVSQSTVGVIINSSFNIIKNINYSVSDFIEVSAGNYVCEYTNNNESTSTATRINFYNTNKEYVSNVLNYSNRTPNEGNVTKDVTIQSNGYVKISYRNTDENIMFASGSTSLPYEPYGYKVPVVVNGKNLLQNNATSRTLNGVTCTVNDDKSVTFTGSPERSFDILFNNSVILNPGTYIYTNGLTQSDSRIRVDMYVPGGNMNYWANPSVTFTTTNTYKFVSRIFIQGNAGELGGLTIYPMLRKANIEDGTYAPYIELTTNIYLDEPIGANESISLSDTNTNIPTIRGTNVLTVDTTVQPSNVYIKSRHESSYEATMRERYEEAQAQLDALESGGE